MREGFRGFLALMMIAALAVLAGCGGGKSTPPPKGPAQLTLTPSATTYAATVGDAPYQVTVAATKSDGGTDTFTVGSSNTSVVTATASGNTVTLTPVGAGTANVIITSGSDPMVLKTIVVTISAPASLTLSPASLTYAATVGDAPYQVTVTATKSNGTADTFTAQSSNTAVVTATTSGNVVTLTPVGAGTANVVFTSGSDATVKKTIATTITVPVSLTLNPASLTYAAVVGDAPYQVAVTATKSNGTADTFTVESSNTAVVTATASGNVVTITPVGAGTANVVFTSGSDATVKKTIAATITVPVSLTLNPAGLTYAAMVGDAPYQVTVTATKSNGTADTFTVESSNPSAVTATASGNVVTITPVGAGTADVVFTSGSDATVKKTIATTITVPVSLTLNPASLNYSAVVGEAPYQVIVTATKSNGTADTFTVESSNTAVVTATASGNLVTITPVGPGAANIVFTSGSDANVKKTIAANVTVQVSLTLNPANLTYSAMVGADPYQATVTATKADGSPDTFTVESSNTSVVTATAVGNLVTITPVGPGSADVVFTSGSDASVKKTIAATITVPVVLTLAPADLTYNAMVGDAAYEVTVTATKNDGSPDTFTIESSNTAVVTATANGNVVTITPVGAGTANVVFTSGSDASLTHTIAVMITAPVNYSGCDGTEWFCDDFQSGNSDNWDLTPNTLGTTPGVFSVIDEPALPGNKVLKYTAGNAAPSPVNLGVIALLKDAVWANVSNKSDYFVEARLMPLYNGTTSNKQLYLIGRYQDASNWYLGGLNCQSSTASTQIEEGWMKAGSISRGSQTKRPIYVPTSTDPDTAGQWHTVRLEMLGSTLTVYLDNEMMSGSKILTDSTFASGKIGLFTANKTFLIDDIRVGDANVKPAQLILASSLTSSAWTAEVGDPPLAVTVTALKPDLTPDTFTVASSNTNVVTATVTGNIVTLNPIGVGTSNIVFTHGSNPKVTRTITATIANSFVMPTTTYDLSGKVVPAAGEAAAYPDGKLVLTFDAPPTIGAAGSIRIFKSSDDSLVDVIKLVDDRDSIGAGYATQARGVVDTPVWVSGNNLVIAPHISKIDYDTGYYVAVANGAVTGTIGGQNFTGIGKLGNWSFTTKASPATNLTTVTVDDDGAADFRSVQGALNYVMKNVPVTTPATINVANGTYQELLFLRGNNNVTIKGESRTGTVIQYNNYDTLNVGSGGSSAGTPTSGGGRALFLVEGSDLLTLDTLTLKNTHLRSAAGSAQAETIYFNNETGRLIAKNAEFWSEQDTLQLKGYAWFYDTLVAGNVDFIWGNNKVALFENSEIRMIGDSKTATPTALYMLQARTNAGEKGFIFLNSRLTTGVGPSGNTLPTGAGAVGYLARAAAGTWEDNILFINCKMDTHINALGWAANIDGNPVPNPATPTVLKGWREFGSMDLAGNPLEVSGRSANSGQLTQTDIDANFANRAMIFSSFAGGWDPQP